jgi:hypothetical protein
MWLDLRHIRCHMSNVGNSFISRRRLTEISKWSEMSNVKQTGFVLIQWVKAAQKHSKTGNSLPDSSHCSSFLICVVVIVIVVTVIIVTDHVQWCSPRSRASWAWSQWLCFVTMLLMTTPSVNVHRDPCLLTQKCLMRHSAFCLRIAGFDV